MATAPKYDADTKSLEKSPSLGLGSSSASADDVDMSQIDKKSLLRRVDLHVLPMLVIVYIFAFLDRVNIGNASVFGMSKELDLKGNQYNVALCVFFIPYILFEIPSNLVLKAVSPRVFLSICIFLFGMVTLCQGFVKKYEQLIVTRLLLGLFETGIFPGAFYILSMWYPRHASQKRFTFFFLSTAIAGAFGGLLAYALGHINARGYTPWRWIFIIEGAITCAIGILSYFTLPEFPEEAKWLTDNERKYIQKRINKDIGDADKAEKIKLSDLSIVFTDYKFILSAIAYFACVIPIYAFAYFCPTILKGWGISALMTQVRTIPIWAFAWIFSMSVAILSDRIRKRFVFIMVPTTIALIGFIILIALPDAHIANANVGVKYFALFLCLAGMFASTPIVVGWFTTNLRTHKQRSIGSAWQIAFGNCGGIVATFVFPAQDGPAYTLGYSVCLGVIVVILVSCSTLYIMMRAENKKFERLEQEQNEEGRAEGEKGFRYLI